MEYDFLNTVAGISPAIAGTIAAIGSIWETLCGAVVGYISDHSETRFGKRKQFLLAAAFPLGVFTTLLFTAIDVSDTFKIVYYTLMLLLFWTGFSCFFVPYLAWGAELTQDYDERTVLRGYTFVFNSAGMAIGMVLPTVIVDFLMGMGILAASIFYLIGYAVFCADRMYYFNYNMKLNSTYITVIMAFMTFASIIFVPFIIKLNKKFDKRTLFIFGMSICVVLMAILGIVGITSMTGLLLFSLAYSLGSICYWQLIPAMIYDVCEVDQLVNQRQRAGLVISLQSLSESVANAIGLQVLGIILQMADFQSNLQEQGEAALFWTNLSFGVIPALFMFFSVVMIVKYPITKAMYQKVLSALEQRNQGMSIDMEQFKKLI